jgi:hypothetical protein
VLEKFQTNWAFILLQLVQLWYDSKIRITQEQIATSWRWWWWSSSRRWGKTTPLKCGHQRSYYSSPDDMSTENYGGMIWTGRNSWFVHQSSLAILPAESCKEEETGEDYEFCLTKYLFHTSKYSLTCRKIWHDADGFSSHPKEAVLRISIAFKNQSSSATFEPWVQWQAR